MLAAVCKKHSKEFGDENYKKMEKHYIQAIGMAVDGEEPVLDDIESALELLVPQVSNLCANVAE